MAKKKRRRAPRAAPTAPNDRPAAAPPRGGANVARRERKEEARRFREAELRRARRSSALRRTGASIAIAAAAAAGIILFRSVSGPNEIPQTAVRAATEAGCTEVEQPAASAPSNLHLTPDQLPYTYTDTPATSGFHETTWISEPKVFEEQPAESRAVHSLEHGGVFVYYLPESSGGVSQAIVDRLAGIARGDQATFLAPYPTLSPERALTLTAWNRRQSCPTGDDLTPERAATIVNGFVYAFECTSNAPEGSNDPC
jgi:hypothetical protein